MFRSILLVSAAVLSLASSGAYAYDGDVGLGQPAHVRQGEPANSEVGLGQRSSDLMRGHLNNQVGKGQPVDSGCSGQLMIGCSSRAKR